MRERNTLGLVKVGAMEMARTGFVGVIETDAIGTVETDAENMAETGAIGAVGEVAVVKGRHKYICIKRR